MQQISYAENSIDPGSSTGIRGQYTNQIGDIQPRIQVRSDNYSAQYPASRTIVHEVGHAVADHARRHSDLANCCEAKTAEFEVIRNNDTERENLEKSIRSENLVCRKQFLDSDEHTCHISKSIIQEQPAGG